MPCWQRVGIADACPDCGCPPFPDDDEEAALMGEDVSPTERADRSGA
jgi:hypothetical protein